MYQSEHTNRNPMIWITARNIVRAAVTENQSTLFVQLESFWYEIHLMVSYVFKLLF